jgi:SAM-dependent methyltransferase
VGQRGLELHPAAAAGFERGAEDYERGRPGFAPGAVALIGGHVGEGTVVDLAAGTGKLTRVIPASVAIEPVAAMRSLLPVTCPGVAAVGGVAEAIPLRDASVDGMTVAQAFHWFEAERALDEIARVLRPGAGLALVWNDRDRTVEWQDRLKDLMTRVAGPLMPRYRSGDRIWEAALAADERFTPVEKHEFPNPVELDRATFAARIASTSYVSILPDDERQAVIEEALALVPPEEPFVERYVTEVHVCSRTS